MEAARDIGKFFCDDVIISALRVFGGDSGAAVTFVEVARFFDVFIILDIGSVVLAARAPESFAALDSIAGTQLFDAAARIVGLFEAVQSIDGIAVRGIAQEHGMFCRPLVGNEAGGEAVIVIGPVWLDVGIVLIESQVHRPS